MWLPRHGRWYDQGMKILGLALITQAAVSGWAERSKPLAVSYDAVIETIQFTDVSEVRQKQVLSSLGVRVGDRLTVEARHRIGLALGAAQSSVAEKRFTFTYTPGAKWGTAKLLINAGC